jgi:hypothetical protein
VNWGHDGAEFVIQTQIGIVIESFNQPVALLTPLFLLAVLGQGFLILSFVPKSIIAYKILTSIGLVLLNIIVFLITVLGLFTSALTLLSVIPFYVLSFFVVKGMLTREQVTI